MLKDTTSLLKTLFLIFAIPVRLFHSYKKIKMEADPGCAIGRVCFVI